jgi:hypothetical protein
MIVHAGDAIRVKQPGMKDLAGGSLETGKYSLLNI